MSGFDSCWRNEVYEEASGSGRNQIVGLRQRRAVYPLACSTRSVLCFPGPSKRGYSGVAAVLRYCEYGDLWLFGLGIAARLCDSEESGDYCLHDNSHSVPVAHMGYANDILSSDDSAEYGFFEVQNAGTSGSCSGLEYFLLLEKIIDPQFLQCFNLRNAVKNSTSSA